MPVAAVAVTPTTAWTIDPTHSTVAFAVRHLMIATARGRFSGVSGTVRLDDRNPANAVADITIDASTIDTREPQRDQHLRSADFFDVEHHPSLTFRSTHVEPADGQALRVTGDLTIRGVTRPVVLNVSVEGRITDPWGNERAGFTAATTINRSDFGLTWNQALEAGGFVVGDEVRISIDVELVRAA